MEATGTLPSISSTSTTMSRHGSIFYDAPEALSALLLNEDKDETEKMVSSRRTHSPLVPFFFQSDSESSSCGDDESHAGDASRQSAIPPQLSTCPPPASPHTDILSALQSHLKSNGVDRRCPRVPRTLRTSACGTSCGRRSARTCRAWPCPSF